MTEVSTNFSDNISSFWNNFKPQRDIDVENRKAKQLEIIQNNNPVHDDYHTWIRSVEDIKTFQEALNDSDYKEYFDSGEDFDESYTNKMARDALEAKDSYGNITQKTISITFTDTQVKERTKAFGKIRFISEKYYGKNKAGGLMENSRWLNDPEFNSLLREALAI